MQQTSNAIFIAEENNLPVIIGNCPTCHAGDRSMVLVDFIPNRNHEFSAVYLKCLCCLNVHQRRIKDVSSED